MTLAHLFAQTSELVTRHPWACLIGALSLGLVAPSWLRRAARWGVVATFWLAVFLYLLPVEVVCIALMMVGVRLVRASEPPPEPSVGASVGPLNVWEQVLSRLNAKINRRSVLTWFIETVFVSDEGGVITVRVRNATVGGRSSSTTRAR